MQGSHQWQQMYQGSYGAPQVSYGASQQYVAAQELHSPQDVQLFYQNCAGQQPQVGAPVPQWHEQQQAQQQTYQQHWQQASSNSVQQGQQQLHQQQWQQPYGNPAQQWQQPSPQPSSNNSSWQQQQQQASVASYPYGSQTASAASLGVDAGLASLVANKINSIIATNRLQYFYPPPAAQSVIDRVSRVNLRQLAADWKINLEIAIDLTALALYDVIIYCDDSTSMRGEGRIDDLKVILGRVATVVTLFDDDGISLRAMNFAGQGDNIRTAADADLWIQHLKFKGGTPLGAELRNKILEPFLYQRLRQQSLRKPIMVVAITDGAPGESLKFNVQVIRDAKAAATNSPYGPGAIAFQYAQVGRDQKAQDFLSKLDAHPEIGGMVDATSYYEMEEQEYARRGVTLTPELWLVKLLVGAIDPSYDEQDEHTGPRMGV